MYFSNIITSICEKCGSQFKQIENNTSCICFDCQFPKKLFKKYKFDNKRYISSEVKKIVWNRDDGRCVCCNSNVELEFDHIIPVSKGGSNFENNIQLLCRHCNRTKSANIV